MAYQEDPIEEQQRRVVALIEQTLSGLGIAPRNCRLPGGDPIRYAVRRGSAHLIIALFRPRFRSEPGTIRVVAPVVQVPADPGRLFRRLLEANASELVGAAFGVVDQAVVLVSERSIVDLDASEVDAMIKHVGRAADRYDDAFAREFGTARVSDVL